MSSDASIIDVEALPMPNWPAEVHPFEPAYGWMQRAAHANYAYSMESFLNVLGLNAVDWNFEEQLEIARQLPIQGYERLEWNTPKRTADGYEICGHRLAARFFSKGVRRACPECLEEGRFIRVWFDIVPIAACPIHDMALIGGLENDPFDWRHPEFGWTRSGVLVKAEHATPARATELDSYIVSALAGLEHEAPPHLAGQPLQAVIQSALCLGRLARADDVRSSTPSDFRKLAQSGFPALLAGQEAIIEFLSYAAWLQPQFDKSRYDARCHYAPQITRTIRSQSLRDLITAAFGAVRIRNGLATPSGRLALYDGEDGYRTMKGVASALGMESKYLRKIVKTTATETKRCPHTWAHRLSAENIDAVARYVDASLSSEDVARILGCAAADIDELVNRRTFEMDFRDRRGRFFQRDAIEVFIARALRGRREGLDPKGSSLSSFAAEAGISLAAAYSQLIRNKKIGLLQYDRLLPFFDGAQVAYFRGTRLRPAAQIKDAITFAKARARLGTGLEGLSQLLQLGFLETLEDSAGRLRISETSLASFERDYARAADYAPSLECPPRSALKLLRKKGVEPINEYGKHIVSFVSRDQVQRITGIKLEGSTGFRILEVIRDQITKLFASASVPATASVVTDPAILVEATSRNWSFRIEPKPGLERYELVARFRSPNEGRRLRKIQSAMIEPERIWPGAEVECYRSGGFIIVDQVEFGKSVEADRSMLARRSVARAHELHRFL